MTTLQPDVLSSLLFPASLGDGGIEAAGNQLLHPDSKLGAPSGGSHGPPALRSSTASQIFATNEQGPGRAELEPGQHALR